MDYSRHNCSWFLLYKNKDLLSTIRTEWLAVPPIKNRICFHFLFQLTSNVWTFHVFRQLGLIGSGDRRLSVKHLNRYCVEKLTDLYEFTFHKIDCQWKENIFIFLKSIFITSAHNFIFYRESSALLFFFTTTYYFLMFLFDFLIAWVLSINLESSWPGK